MIKISLFLFKYKTSGGDLAHGQLNSPKEHTNEDVDGQHLWIDVITSVVMNSEVANKLKHGQEASTLTNRTQNITKNLSIFLYEKIYICFFLK